MALVRPHHRFRGETSFTAGRLLEVVADQIGLVAPVQTRYRVSTVPTLRSLRFYTARGLVDKPLAREGTQARYGYRHLLQLLVVKHLQSQYLPLEKIRSLMDGTDNRELEQLLPEVGAASARHLLRAAPPAPGRAAAAAPAREEPGADPGDDAWHRIEVSPGVELHVHAAALSPGDRERLRGALLREMGRLRGWG